MSWPVVLALAGSLGAPPRPQAVDDGSVALTCQWPTVVSYRAGDQKCSALLVHPEVIVTAAHCIVDAPAGRIRFGEQYQPAAFIVDTIRCDVHPDYRDTGAPSADLGWCTLAEPVTGIPPTPLLAECEAAWATAGTPAVIVGYGATTTDDLFGTKRYAFTVLDSEIRSDGTVWVGDDEVNGCLGDSGGPAFIRSPAGTWHALGVLAHGPECGAGPVLYRTLHDRIAWLEAQSGFDVTPCHDADGRWDPGPDCEPLAADPLGHDGRGASWDDRCDGPRLDAPVCEASEPPDASTEPDATDDAALDESAPTSGCACATRPRDRGLAGVLLLTALAFPAAWRRGRRRTRR